CSRIFLPITSSPFERAKERSAVCRSLGKRQVSVTGLSTACVALALLIASLAWPVDAAAQSERVFRTLASLHDALECTYGDEGAEVGRLLDDLSQALAEWDRSIRETEMRLRARIDGSPQEAAAAHEALGFLYLERSRFPDAIAELEGASTLAPTLASPHLLRG